MARRTTMTAERGDRFQLKKGVSRVSLYLLVLVIFPTTTESSLAHHSISSKVKRGVYESLSNCALHFVILNYIQPTESRTVQESTFSARQALVASLDEGTGGTDNDDVASSISRSPSVSDV
jgi:hypothetical protein